MSTSPGASLLLCPGQGAQRVGMGKAWFERDEHARRVLAAADDILGDRLGARLTDICFSGPEDRLNRTDAAQPALFACAVASHAALLASGALPAPVAAAGLSLGEYTALHLAGAVSFADGLRIVALRGGAMQRAAEKSRGGMVALIGADEAQARRVCDDAANGEVLVPANFNAPGQIVLSGHAGACDRAVAAAEALGLKASRLAVAGAFHSPLMAPAAEELARALDSVEMRAPAFPVYSNVTAEAHGTGPDAAKPVPACIKARLVEQVSAPVRWDESCRAMLARWPASAAAPHELAPGKVLAGLMRRIDRAAKVESHDEPSSN